MVKRLGVIAEMETTPLAVAVTGTPGGAGAAIDYTQASSSVSITNTSNGAALEYKAGAGVWVKLQASDGVELAIDLATTALAFRRARYDGGLASVSLVIAGKPTLKSAEGGLPIASGSATAATLTGTFAIGQTITATLPAGVVGTLQFTRTLVAAPFTKSAIAGAAASAVNSLAYMLVNADGGCTVGVDASNQVSPTLGGVVPAGVATLISASSRQGIPAGWNGFGGNFSTAYRINDYAQQAVDDPSGMYFNMASFPNITDGQQERPCPCPVYVSVSLLTNTDGTGALDQSAATLTSSTWTKAAAGTVGYLVKLVGNSFITPSAADFTAAGGLVVDSGATILCPPGYGVRFDEMTTIKSLRGKYIRLVEFTGAAPVTMTIPAGTYTAGTPIPFSGQTAAPVNNWKYLASGTGITPAGNTVASSSGTVASFDGSGVLTLSRDFTSTGGTITCQSVFAGATSDYGNGALFDANKSASSRGQAVRYKNWTTSNTPPVNGVGISTGGVLPDIAWMVGANQAGLGCVLIGETSIGNGHHDASPDGHWGDAMSSSGPFRRACNINKLPSVRIAVSGSSMHYEIPSAAFPNSAYGPMKQFMASICTMILSSGPYNTRGFPWNGAVGVGLKAMQQAYNTTYKNACRTGSTTVVYACSMFPSATGTFATAAGQTAGATSIDPSGSNMQYRAWLMGSGRVPSNGDPDVGIDILLPLYTLAAANGLALPGTDAQNSVDIGKWPYSADWVASSYRGSTFDGTHENYTTAVYLAPVIAAQLPVYS